MALFHIYSLLENDLLQQIIKVDDVVLHLKVRNSIRQKGITAGH